MANNYSYHSLSTRLGNVKAQLITIKGVIRQQWQIAKSYLVNTSIFIFVPLILAALPILLYRALDVDPNTISANFGFTSGQAQHLNAYIIFGVNMWMLILAILWDFSTYLRDEQYTGTLESLLLSPAKRYSLLIGRALFSITFNVFIALLSIIVSITIFDFTLFFTSTFLHLLLALMIVIIGCFPMMGLSYLIGALVLKFKEVYSFINTLQWFFGVIMGIYAPFTTLPLILKVLGFIFPGTWSVTDIRAITLGTPPMMMLLGLKSIGTPILVDTVIVILFGLFWALVGYALFSKVEMRLKKREGLSEY